MSKKTVLIDLERLRYPKSGIAKVFSNLLLGLSEMQVQKFDITIFGPESLSLEHRFKNLQWKKWQKFSPFFGNRYQLIHVSHQLSSYFQRKTNSQKKIVTLHDLNFLHENFSSSKVNRNIRQVSKNIRNADAVVCISNFVKQDYLKNQHLFKPQKMQRVEVIYNGLVFPDNSVQYSLGKFDFLKEKKYFLNIGVLFSKKNQLSLLEILPELDEDLVLVVSGSKKEYEEMVMARIRSLNLEKKVHILYNISEEEKLALIQNCTAMLHPSLAEGFGIPPIEAMHFGKPVFLSKLTSLPEIGGELAFYFDSFEKEVMLNTIRKGMSLYNEKPNYKNELCSWASRYDYRKMAENYLELYQEVLTS